MKPTAIIERRNAWKTPHWSGLWGTGLIATALCVPLQAQPAPGTQPWTVETLITRRHAEGGPASTGLAVHVPANQPVKHVVLYLSPNETPFLAISRGTTALNLIGPWVRAAATLGEHGIAVAFADAPSDAQGQGPTTRALADLRQDVKVIVAHLQKTFAGVPVHLGAFGSGAAPSLDIAARVNGIARIVVASGAFLNDRDRDWRELKKPVMVIHAPSATCGAAPFLEVQWVARRNGFALVEAGYEKPAASLACGSDSQHLLSGLDVAFAETVSRWLDGADAPKIIGHPDPPVAWREQIVTYPAPGLIGVNQLEMTLMLPNGPGPFPVAVFNHGDVDSDSAFVRHRQRMRELPVAREFLQLGIAIALPARRGVGWSEGTYPAGFARHDGDALYKPKVHAQDILPALSYLTTRPEIDARRIILTGHSAGGYSALFIGRTPPPGVIGMVNWSGGRTDATEYERASLVNRMMIRGFAELGQTTRLPSLWVFAENDSKYTPDTIRASHAAYTRAGGTATLVLTPPTADDGHFVYHQPALWRGALQDFLSKIGAFTRDAAPSH